MGHEAFSYTLSDPHSSNKNRGTCMPPDSGIAFKDYDDVQLRIFLRECRGDPEWGAAQTEWVKRHGSPYDPFPGLKEGV